MSDIHAIPGLIKVLDSLDKDPMVRYEAAEALGALSHMSALDILEKYHNDPYISVTETCEQTIENINFHNNEKLKENTLKHIVYTSNDPAPGAPSFKHYHATFGPHKVGTNEAVAILCEDFKDKSALFKYEVAFVLRQMQNPNSAPALIKALDDSNEAPMVRHEAAETLGFIATPDCLPVLRKYRNDYM
ncbi:deoxyhypusine hydroxylase [Basidiobolus ranarum]|uniref:Deoxyhypusine hydroxylase n=1 Tax=Basidiobolus ranarum TaxID=34480 RepID=A0ABR2WIE6_9FUNG